jgi:hypothetical protein
MSFHSWGSLSYGIMAHLERRIMKRHNSWMHVGATLAILFMPVLLAAEAGPSLKTGRIGAACATTNDGRLLVAGGHGAGFVALSSIELGAPETGGFTELSLPGKFDYGAIARLDDGRFLLAGSADNLGIAPGNATAFLFNPADDSIVSTGSMNRPRMNCAAATLANGTVLVVGGWYDSGSPLYAEHYDPTTGSFRETGSLVSGRALPVVLPTQDGRALVMGGVPAYGGSVYETVEVYDPVENTFSLLRNELVEGDPGWRVTYTLKEPGELLLPDGRYALPTSNDGRYGILLYDPVTLACSVEEVPDDILDGSGIGSLALDGTRIFFYLVKAVDSGPASTVRIAGYDQAVGMESVAVTEPMNLVYTPYYSVSAIRGGRFFAAGGTSSTGSQSNFGSVSDTFWMDLPALSTPSDNGHYYIDFPWAYHYDQERWIYIFDTIPAYDYQSEEEILLGEGVR